jgi:hypothetical protein
LVLAAGAERSEYVARGGRYRMLNV